MKIIIKANKKGFFYRGSFVNNLLKFWFLPTNIKQNDDRQGEKDFNSLEPNY
jgi:hypothetical protein